MDIIENIKSVLRAASDVGDKFDKFNTRSIARGAQEQSFIFPALVDRTVPIDHAHIITRNLDRVYASWTQIYLSSIGFIDLNYIKNPRQFIRQYQPKFMLEDGSECDPELTSALYGDDETLFSEAVGSHTIIACITPQQGKEVIAQKMIKENVPHLDGLNLSGIRAFSEAEENNDMLDNLIQGTMNQNELRNNTERIKAYKDARGPRLSDMDVKKSNDMQPYMLELKLLASKGDSSFSEWINYTIGVKTWMHAADTDKLTAAIVYTLQNRDPIFNFIRWTTGEISFFKDLILHLDDINFDVASKTDKTGKFIATCRKMKKQYLKAGTFGVNRMAPMATFVISSSTYHDIKNRYGFDLKNMTFAKKIMDELFLMSLVIVDDVNATIDMLVDGQYDFQTYALETLEREVAMNSNKLGKELTRMLGSGM